MKKTFNSLLILLMLMSTLYGCGTPKNYHSSSIDDVSLKSAEDFLKAKAYNIVTVNGKVDSYILSGEKLNSANYSNIWGLQMLNVKSFIGKTVDVYGFTIKSHPLDHARDNNKHQTKVWIMVVENAVVGGYSLPDYDEVHNGGVYSIDGKTLEEVTGLSFQEWSDRWKKDYNSQESQKTFNPISKSIEDKLDAIILNPKCMVSSNPYVYIRNNEDYEYIVKQGEKALNYMLDKFKNSNENGLKEYVMAIACSEILGEKPEQKNWSSGREWYEHYIKSREKVDNISTKGNIMEKTRDSTTVKDGTSKKITLDEIKKTYTEESILSIHQFKDNYVLVESQRPTCANKFTLFDLKAGKSVELPTLPHFIKLEKIVDENQIIFLSSGRNSEEPSYCTFPCILKYIRESSNGNSNEFKEIVEDKFFKLEEKSNFGSKAGMATDIKTTEEGIKMNFIPIPGNEGDFWADYTNVPETTVDFDKNKHRIVFELKDSKVDPGYLKGTVQSNVDNPYIKSFRFDISGNNVRLTVDLNDNAREYNVKIGYNANNMPFEMIRFR